MATTIQGLSIPDIVSSIISMSPVFNSTFRQRAPMGVNPLKSPVGVVNGVSRPTALTIARAGVVAKAAAATRKTNYSVEFDIFNAVSQNYSFRFLDIEFANFDLQARELNQLARYFSNFCDQVCLYGWYPKTSRGTLTTRSGRFRAATGGNISGRTLHSGGPANVKAPSIDDIRNAKAGLINSGVLSGQDADGTFIVMPATAWTQFASQPEIRNALNFGLPTLPSGVVAMIDGMKLYVVPDVYLTVNRTAANTFSVNVPGTAAAAGHRMVTLVCHEDYIQRSESAPMFHMQVQNSEYLGSTMAGEISCGGTYAVEDAEGVFAIVHQE